ncbi:MAG: acyl carrier protein [Pyrinomonadaceae bacterium]
MNSANEIAIWLRNRIAAEIKCDPDEIATDTEFTALGMDSLMSVSLADELAGVLGISLDPTIFWEFDSIAELTKWLEDNKLKQ